MSTSRSLHACRIAPTSPKAAMPTASATGTSSPSRLPSGSKGVLTFQQYQNGAAAALRRGRLAEGEHLFAQQPLPQQPLQHRLALARAEAFAVHDAHAAPATPAAMAQEFRDTDGGDVPVHAVQVELVLDHPVAAPQFGQDVARTPALR